MDQGAGRVRAWVPPPLTSARSFAPPSLLTTTSPFASSRTTAGVGPGWPDQHPALLAVLLPQHGRHHLRGGQRGRGAACHRQAGAVCNAGRRGTPGLHSPRLCQQAGPERRTQRQPGKRRQSRIWLWGDFSRPAFIFLSPLSRISRQ